MVRAGLRGESWRCTRPGWEHALPSLGDGRWAGLGWFHQLPHEAQNRCVSGLGRLLQYRSPRLEFQLVDHAEALGASAAVLTLLQKRETVQPPPSKGKRAVPLRRTGVYSPKPGGLIQSFRGLRPVMAPGQAVPGGFPAAPVAAQRDRHRPLQAGLARVLVVGRPADCCAPHPQGHGPAAEAVW